MRDILLAFCHSGQQAELLALLKRTRKCPLKLTNKFVFRAFPDQMESSDPDKKALNQKFRA